MSAEMHGPQLYTLLRRRVLDGSYAPGTVLREVSLADELGVSRTPVREALARLEHDGLLERSARGLFVKQSSVDEIMHVYETCLILEPEAARLGASRHTALDLLRLRENLDLAARAIESGDDPRPLMDEWHRLVWRAARNPVLEELLERVSALLMTGGRSDSPNEPIDWMSGLATHTAITDAIAAHEFVQAGDLMAEHMQGARDSAIRAASN